jgi:hypothetical protein
MNIKFSHKYSKLYTGRAEGENFCKNILLLDVMNIKLEERSKEFLDYDTDDGLFKLPKKGDYMMLIFRKTDMIFGSNLMTTLRRWTPEKEKYYRDAIGKWFNVIIEK